MVQYRHRDYCTLINCRCILDKKEKERERITSFLFFFRSFPRCYASSSAPVVGKCAGRI